MFKRDTFDILLKRLNESRKHMQVIMGPRQVGKTTLVKQVLAELSIPVHYATADKPTVQDIAWLNQQWDIGRVRAQDQENTHKKALLVLDEIQKIVGWSDVVKALWDEDTFEEVDLLVVLIDSAPLLLNQGLTDSLAGRFELIRMTHWSYTEMREVFDWSLDKYIYFGGYPGAADYIDDEQRWEDYVSNTLIETTISRDILLMNRVDKPMLLRRLFELGCRYSGQILSYQKMLGQLYDVGNTTTIAHYLELLSGVGMLTGLEKYSGAVIRQKTSSPKLQVLNTGLISAIKQTSFKEAKEDRAYWGRLLGSAVGAYFVNEGCRCHMALYYWRERNKEIDFVVQKGKTLVAFEVKSGSQKKVISGMHDFQALYHPKRILLLGGQGISLEEFFLSPLEKWCQ